MKIIRNLLILGGVVFFIPTPPALEGEPEATPSTFALMSAAGEAFSDVKTFCVRKPQVCETADYLVSRAEAKAKYSIKFLYEWANKAAEPSHAFFNPPVSLDLNGSVALTENVNDDIQTGTITPAPVELRPTLLD